MPEHPKGYPLERLVEECCPDGIESIAEGVTLTLETIAERYSSGRKPRLPSHGVPGLDVLARVPQEDFAAFVRASATAAKVARIALDSDVLEASARGWRELLGPEFPEPASTSLSVRAPADLVALDRQDGFFAQLRERRDIFVRGMEDISRLKRTLDRAVEQLGIRIEYAPESPPELLDHLGVMGLTAARGAIIGGTVGLAIGALVKDPKPWTALGTAIGTLWGLYQGQQRVHAGWRIEMGYDAEGIPWLILKALPRGS